MHGRWGARGTKTLVTGPLKRVTYLSCSTLARTGAGGGETRAWPPPETAMSPFYAGLTKTAVFGTSARPRRPRKRGSSRLSSFCGRKDAPWARACAPGRPEEGTSKSFSGFGPSGARGTRTLAAWPQKEDIWMCSSGPWKLGVRGITMCGSMLARRGINPSFTWLSAAVGLCSPSAKRGPTLVPLLVLRPRGDDDVRSS